MTSAPTRRGPRPTRRQALLFGALGLSLVATAWVSREDEAEPATVAPRRLAAARTATPEWPGPAASARADWPAADPQALTAWGEAPRPAAPPPVAAAPAEPPDEPPPPPQAPPIPSQVVGRLTDARPRGAVVGVGEVVDGQWRVDAIEANGLRLTYLPLGQSQFVSFASPAA